MDPKQITGILLPILFIIFFMTPYQPRILEFSKMVVGKLLFVCIILFYAEMDLTWGFLALVFVVFYYKIFFPLDLEKGSISEKTGSPIGIITPRTKETEEPHVVPLLIYQTWHSKNLPPKMAACMERLKQQNPEFDHYLYDDADCRAFIKNHYDAEVLETYDQLIPGAYKADLWRYCVLYKTGGIYLDIKFQCEPGFSLMEMTKESENFVLDRPYGDGSMPLEVNLAIINAPDFYKKLPNYTEGLWPDRELGLYNAVIATVPNNPILYDCIQQIVKHVRANYYGPNPLYPTGPGLFGQMYFKDDYANKVKQVNYFNSIVGTYIINKKRKVLSQYPEYRMEQRTYTPVGPLFYYHDLWYSQKIYGKIQRKR